MSLVLRNRNPLWSEFTTSFDDLFNDLPVAKRGNGVKSNIFNLENSVGVEIEVPGYSREDLSLHIEDDILTIEGNHEETESEKKYVRREFVKRSFKQTFPLGKDIDAESAKAEFENGVLTITFAKIEKAKAKKIEIGRP